MKIILDIEANSLVRPTKIWCIVCKDLDTGERHVFRNVHEDASAFVEAAKRFDMVIGHNILDYDLPVICRVAPACKASVERILREDMAIDTLIVSRMVDYPRKAGHSLGSWGEEFGLEKFKFSDWTKWSQQMEDYCVRDVDVCERLYHHLSRDLNDPERSASFKTEHQFQAVVNGLHDNGFSFNRKRAHGLLAKVIKELNTLDADIKLFFPAKLKLVKVVEPRRTKHGTLHRQDFRFVPDGDLSDYNGGPFCRCVWQHFNPSSHKQLVNVLNGAGWRPTDRTAAYIDLSRELGRLKYRPKEGVDLSELRDKLEALENTAWKVNENNLTTLPPSAPKPARTLAKRILLEARRRTLVEWLSLVAEDDRIHGKFVGIGAWTHRMAHQNPNVANIPTDGKLYGAEMRSLWRAPRDRLLVGVDAEGIQLRVFAHYIDDKEFTEALVNGRKEDKTDPHSLNARVLGCGRNEAKRFIYAWLLGAGNGKLAQILGVSPGEAEEALSRLYEKYSGLAHLKREVIPSDARRGWFKGLDGRKVVLPGSSVGERKHLCMSGYLQNGEAVIMKMAALEWAHALEKRNSLLVNFVHDEWQTEVPNDQSVALEIAALQAESLHTVGVRLGLKCPLAGSYQIGENWSETH